MSFSNNFREIVLDAETTGLSYESGDRIVDIGCVELINHVKTGKTYQTYINPQREMSTGATSISGITSDFLKDKPLFHEIVDDFLDFIGDSTLVIHNARFDLGFLNNELAKVGKPLFDLAKAVDTLESARKKFPGMPVNLDALCRRFDIDRSARVTHGALVDSYLLAEVYINLLGGSQSSLSFSVDGTVSASGTDLKNRKKHQERFFPPSAEEIALHAELLKNLNNPIWHKF
jgi:DNA polymerase-3 subunit epsilon